MCFEILGFDVLLDSDLKPWLLEINHTPSFRCGSPLDLRIKKGIIRDTLRLVNINLKDKIKFIKKYQTQYHSRVRTGVRQLISVRKLKRQRMRYLMYMDRYTKKNHGNYKQIYPVTQSDARIQDVTKYLKYMNVAQNFYEIGLSRRSSMARRSIDTK